MKDNDILKDKSLKEMPFCVPDGYFEKMKLGIKSGSRMGHEVHDFLRSAMSYAAVAAITALLVVAGGLILERNSQKDISEAEGLYADSKVMTEEDIIEYVIYTGIEVEEIEQY